MADMMSCSSFFFFLARCYHLPDVPYVISDNAVNLDADRTVLRILQFQGFHLDHSHI